ncbi:uncharacterized protein BJ171DRAFT_471191 [Polychytrium aggregatum]|uniref:uncharacterized protein n=1 Tax=Polychytrium aggregatum TaxID=110093 RepID=UPI0022FDDBE3|nr:uncharacterized protein BJ171DRAFT_471191 [Polychytrium aggregatum]KAI9208836.1 hypothetical protein BJ171DRAFT_471191 [Polychytrium aggregatum]
MITVIDRPSSPITLVTLDRLVANIGAGSSASDDGIKLMTITFHNLLHIPECVVMNGPPCYNWQFFLERFGGWIMKLVNSRSKPIENLGNELRTIEAVNQYYSEMAPIGETLETQQQATIGAADLYNFTHGSETWTFMKRFGQIAVDESIHDLLRKAYAQLLMAAEPSTCPRSAFELELQVQREMPLRSHLEFAESYCNFRRGDLIVEGSENPITNRPRVNSWIRVRIFSTTYSKFVVRYHQARKFIKHQYCGATHHFAYCDVPEDDPEQVHPDGEYKRCPKTKSIRFGAQTRWTKAFVAVECILTTVSCLEHNGAANPLESLSLTEKFIFDDGNQVEYIRRETSREYI